MVSETVQIGVCLNVCGIKGVVFFREQGRLHDKLGPESMYARYTGYSVG